MKNYFSQRHLAPNFFRRPASILHSMSGEESSTTRTDSQPYSAQAARSGYGLPRLETNHMLGFGRSISSSSPVDSDNSTPLSSSPSTPLSASDSFDTPTALNGVFFSRPLPPSNTPGVAHELEQAQAVLRGMFEERPNFSITSNEAVDRPSAFSSLATMSSYRRPRVMSMSSVQSSDSTFSDTPSSHGHNYGSFTSERSFFPPAPNPPPISLPVSPPRNRVDSSSSTAPSAISSRMSILNDPRERHARSTNGSHDNHTFPTPHPVTPGPRHRADSMGPTQRSQSAASERRPIPPPRSTSSASNPVYSERRGSPETSDSGSSYSRRPLPAPPATPHNYHRSLRASQPTAPINDIQFPASRTHSSSPTNLHASSSRPADNVAPQTRDRKSSSGRISPPGSTQNNRARKVSTDSRSAAGYYAASSTRDPPTTTNKPQEQTSSSFSASRRQRRYSTAPDNAPSRMSFAGIQETAIEAIYEEPTRERRPSVIHQAEPRRRNSDGEHNTGNRLYKRESQRVQGVRWNANLICPSPVLPSQRRQGWYNQRGDQLWTNTGAYKPPSPGSEYPPDLVDYPDYGEGWMNEDGTKIDMEHRLIPKVPLRSALKQ